MVNTACPSDEELIPLLVGESADAVIESHLQDCPVCRRRLDLFRSDLNALRSVSMLSGEEMVDRNASPPPVRPARIGKYLVVGTLDSGGQADVYRAVHPTLDKELAIKLCRRAVGSLSNHRPLLIAEGKLLAKLDHPNLARVYDLDFHDDQPFLAMEFVRGPNLRQFAKDVPVSPKEAARIVAETARALAVVHKHGVVHQDVKPQNILIDETGRPRLIDFGMARLRHAWDDSGERTSGGTPAFVAPEQARGEEAAVGPRSDIFALGGVLYLLLTGKVPFVVETAQDTLAIAGRCEFDKAALEKPTIPRGLRDICLKAMAANPADRYARADDFADALERYLTRPKRVARLASAGFGLLFLVAIIAAAASGIFSPRNAIVPQPAQQQPPAAQPAALEVVVTRDEQNLTLADALPLQAANDRLQIIARVPPKHHAVLLHFNADGKVEQLPLRESGSDGYTRFIYPAAPGELARLNGPPGTEFLLLCAAESPDKLDNLNELLRSRLMGPRDDTPDSPDAGLPPLPAKTLIWLDRDEPRVESQPLTGAGQNPKAVAAHRLDELRKKLSDRKLSVIRGVAYVRDAEKK